MSHDSWVKNITDTDMGMGHAMSLVAASLGGMLTEFHANGVSREFVTRSHMVEEQFLGVLGRFSALEAERTVKALLAAATAPNFTKAHETAVAQVAAAREVMQPTAPPLKVGNAAPSSGGVSNVGRLLPPPQVIRNPATGKMCLVWFDADEKQHVDPLPEDETPSADSSMHDDVTLPETPLAKEADSVGVSEQSGT